MRVKYNLKQTLLQAIAWIEVIYESTSTMTASKTSAHYSEMVKEWIAILAQLTKLNVVCV